MNGIRHDLIRMSDIHYTIKSQTTSRLYHLDKLEGVWHCSCSDHTYRKSKNCKHLQILHQETAYTNERRIRNKTEIRPVNIGIISCTICNSHKIVKNGCRKTTWGKVQRYMCRCCKKSFCDNIGFEYAKRNPKAIVTAIHLYFSGESLRSTARTLSVMNLANVSHQTVYKWIKLYIKKIEKYLDSITPQVGHDSWRADEIFLKISGKIKYLFIMMDDETRFIIAQEVADRKEGHNARGLLQKAKQVTGTKPRAFITDGLGSYHTAYRKEFFTIKRAGRTMHLRHIHLQKDLNNNKMERFNGEFRDREKTMRGLQKVYSPILTGYQIFHNYIRPHSGIGNVTPAEKCGIIIHGKNKWLTLIQNASKK